MKVDITAEDCWQKHLQAMGGEKNALAIKTRLWREA